MILNINTVVALMNHMENTLVTLLPLFALIVVFFVVPLAIATIIATIETITLKEYPQIIQTVYLVTNILILGFYLSFPTVYNRKCNQSLTRNTIKRNEVTLCYNPISYNTTTNRRIIPRRFIRNRHR